MVPPRPPRRQYHPVRSHTTKATPPPPAVYPPAPKPYRNTSKAGEQVFAKEWIQTRISRAKTLPEHLKTPEDRLMTWVDPGTETVLAPRAETTSFTMQMLGLLKPDGGLGGVFAPSGAMAAHPGTYLAAQSAVLGIVPVVGLSKGNCVNCEEEVGKAGAGVWWKCKGCSIGKSFICGDCFARGAKCGGGHTVDSHHTEGGGEREVGHVLVRHGHIADAEGIDNHIKNMHDESILPSNKVRCVISEFYLPGGNCY